MPQHIANAKSFFSVLKPSCCILHLTKTRCYFNAVCCYTEPFFST